MQAAGRKKKHTHDPAAATAATADRKRSCLPYRSDGHLRQGGPNVVRSERRQHIHADPRKKKRTIKQNNSHLPHCVCVACDLMRKRFRLPVVAPPPRAFRIKTNSGRQQSLANATNFFITFSTKKRRRRGEGRVAEQKRP